MPGFFSATGGGAGLDSDAADEVPMRVKGWVKGGGNE
jgi:hypothetical protein